MTRSGVVFLENRVVDNGSRHKEIMGPEDRHSKRPQLLQTQKHTPRLISRTEKFDHRKTEAL
jgi:hypothetical protein